MYTVALCAAIFASVWLIFRRPWKGKLPPGPKPWPIIGNTLQMPLEQQWRVFSEWEKTYGSIIQLDVLGQPIVTLNSIKAAKDLLDKRSSIYSDRPILTMSGKLVGFANTFVMLHYGDVWRKQRRMASQGFNISKVPQYYGLQEREGATLVHNLLSNPNSLFTEVTLRVGVIICHVVYGYPVKSATDEMLKDIMEIMGIFNKTTTAGSFFVDSLPALQYLPRWMPGSKFLELAEIWRAKLDRTARNPFIWCKTNLETGKARMSSLCGTIIQEAGEEPSEEDQEHMIWASVTMFGGGLDTSTSSILSFFMAMVLHPDVQTKARAELDAVVGTERLPLISDRAKLPYVRGIITEVLRWAPAVPLGVPHALGQDDEYEGYHFKKGTIFLSNIWHMLHDPEVYPNPAEFKPERYDGSDEVMSRVGDLAFGFGRRACPGRYFADGTLFSVVATTLATCHVLPALDENGRKALPKYAYTSGTVSFPEKFGTRLECRSKQAAALLAEASILVD